MADTPSLRASARAAAGAAHVCTDCGDAVPAQDDDSTLVSVKYGWRLIRRADSSGTMVSEWRCPRCWTRYRQGGSGSSGNR